MEDVIFRQQPFWQIKFKENREASSNSLFYIIDFCCWGEYAKPSQIPESNKKEFKFIGA